MPHPWLSQLREIVSTLGSDTDAAHAIGVNPQSVRAWLHDGRRPAASSLLKIGALYSKIEGPRHIPRDLGTPDAQEAAAESLILARQTCAAVLEMISIEMCHIQAERCLEAIDRKLARLT